MNKLSSIALAAGTMFMISCGGGEEAAEQLNDMASTMESEMEAIADEMNEEATFNVNTENSTVNWKGSMMGMYDHVGTIKVKEGSITTNGGAVTGGSVTIDMTGINAPADETFNEEKTPDMLVGHLASADFFDVENNPTASFEITGAGEGTVTGQLTIKGVTKEATISDVAVSSEGDVMTATGNLTFNRQDFGITWAHPVKENVLSDDISLTIELSADKSAS